MSKLAPTSIKYIIKAQIKAEGVIEKPDVIGAIFGQTEGLLGSDLDLRELQNTGRIGRIEVNINSSKGKSEGTIIIPSSMDSAETALIAATLETIDRVGPCMAEIKLLEVEDTRSVKRDYVVAKAKTILKGMVDSNLLDPSEISEQIKESIRADEIASYKGLPCGPAMESSQSIIITEGRADIINLLRYGIKNTIAIGGTSVPDDVAELCREKVVTLFVDGDRGGQLIVREMLQKCDVDYVAQAPEGKEVEELSKKEVYKALREKVDPQQFLAYLKKAPAREEKSNMSESFQGKPSGNHARMRDRRNSDRGWQGRDVEFKRLEIDQAEKDLYRKTLEELVGTRACCIFNQNKEILGRVPVSELANAIKNIESPYAIVFDGTVDFQLNSIAKARGIKVLVGMEKQEMKSPVLILSRGDL